MKRESLILTVLACTAIVELLLAFRLWSQLAGRPVAPDTSALMFVTDYLALPFRLVTGKAPLEDTGVVDYTLLTAMEGYFIAMLAFLVLTFMFGRTTGWLAEHRSVDVPYFVIAERNSLLERPVMRRAASQRHRGVEIFLKTGRRSRPPPQLARLAATRNGDDVTSI